MDRKCICGRGNAAAALNTLLAEYYPFQLSVSAFHFSFPFQFSVSAFHFSFPFQLSISVFRFSFQFPPFPLAPLSTCPNKTFGSHSGGIDSCSMTTFRALYKDLQFHSQSPCQRQPFCLDRVDSYIMLTCYSPSY